MAIFKPHNFTKNDHRWNIFSNLSSGQQYLSNDIKKFRQKWLDKKSKFVWRKKKNPPRAQIFRYFRIESRNNHNNNNHNENKNECFCDSQRIYKRLSLLSKHSRFLIFLHSRFILYKKLFCAEQSSFASSGAFKWYNNCSWNRFCCFNGVLLFLKLEVKWELVLAI